MITVILLIIGVLTVLVSSLYGYLAYLAFQDKARALGSVMIFVALAQFGVGAFLILFS